MARERLLVMNGTRVLQSEGAGGAWQNAKVTPETAGQNLKPGFYNLFAAQRPGVCGAQVSPASFFWRYVPRQVAQMRLDSVH